MYVPLRTLNTNTDPTDEDEVKWIHYDGVVEKMH